MKKYALIFAIMAAMILSACGGKSENVQTQAAQTAAASSGGGPAADAIAETRPEAAVVALPEEYDPQFTEGTVSDYIGSVITVDGMSFDISNCESDSENPLTRGCFVEVSYADAPEGDIYPADNVIVLNDNEQLAAEEERDPVIYGKLQYLDVNEVEIIDDAGRDLSFDAAIARTVSFADLKQGEDVVITYAGSIYSEERGEGSFNDTPVAIKIVASDALKSEDAMANYVDGVVYGIDGQNMILSTAVADIECTGDASVLADVQEEQPVRVYYNGSLAALGVEVVKVEKR